MKQKALCTTLCSLILMSGPALFADTVYLKDGKVYKNVKAFPRHGAHRILFASGSQILLANSLIAKVRIGSVHWPKRHPRKETEKSPPKKVPRPQTAREEAPLPGIRESWQFGAVWKSLAVPGWGQLAMGHTWRGAVFFGGSMLVLNDYLAKRRLHAQAQEEYSEQLTPILLSTQGTNGYFLFLGILEYEKSVLLRRERETNDRVLLLGLVWGYNIIDAFLLANPRATHRHPWLRHLQIGLDPESSSIQSLAIYQKGAANRGGSKSRLALNFRFGF